MRDRYEEIRELDAEVLAVSAEPLAAAAAEATAAGLPFPVVSDADLAVIGAFGVLDIDEPEGRRIARPAVFLIDRGGTLRFAYVGEHAQDRPTAGMLLLALESMP